MSRQTDEQIISMKFDNQQFERNAQKTLGTIADLKKSMKFDDVGKGFENITRAAEKVDFSGLVDDVNSLQKRFSVLGSTIYNEIQGAVDKSIAAVKNLYSELTNIPRKSGFEEYETQINAVQTIWANTKDKGVSMDEITKALDELNTYADKTIYNFTEMTRNIGTFTAAGVDLKTSVQAIQGIANLGAVSGSTSEQVSRAMYQISQALASGSVKLQDWNSIVNAGMGGEGFQKVLKETAREHNIAVDAMIEKRGSFRDSLRDEWLTTEVMTEALAKYTDTTTELGRTATDAATKVKTFTQLLDTTKEMLQSGWTQSWTYILGGFEEARELFTNISYALTDLLQPAQDARNAMLKYWTENGVLDKELSEKAKEQKRVSDEITSIAKEIISGKYGNETERRDILKDMGFDPDTVEQRVKDVELAIQNGTEYIDKTLESSMTGREYALKGLTNIATTFVQIVNAIRAAWKDAFPPMTGERLISLSKAFYDFTERIKANERMIFNVRRTFGGLFSILSIGVTIVKSFLSGISAIFGALSKGNIGFLELTGTIGDCLLIFNHWLKQSGVLTKTFTTVGSTIGKILGKVIALIKDAFNAIRIIFDYFNISEIISKILSSVNFLYEKVMSVLGKFKTAPTGDINVFSNNVVNALEPIAKAGNFIKKIWTGITEVFKAVLAHALPVLKELKQQFIDFTGIKDLNSLIDIIQNGGITALIYKLVSFVSGLGKTTNGLSDIIGGITDVLGSLKNVINSFALSIKIQSLKAIASSLVMLSVAVVALGVLPKSILKNGLTTLAVLLGELSVALIIMGKLGLAGIAKNLVSISIAINTLIIPITALGLIPWGIAIKGMTNLAIILGELVLAIRLLQTEQKKLTGVAGSLLALGIAINMLVLPIALLGAIPGEFIGKGVAYVTISLLALAGAIKIMTTALGKQLPNITKQLLSLSVAINMLVLPIVALGLLKFEDLAQGLIAVAALLLELSVAVWALALVADDKKAKNIKSITSALSGALLAITAAIYILGNMDPDRLKEGAACVGGAMGAILIMTLLFSKFENADAAMAKFGVGMAGIGVGLLALAEAFDKIGDMKPETIKAGLITLGAVLLEFGIFVGVMDKFIEGDDTGKKLLEISAAIAILSASMIIVAAALNMMEGLDFASTVGHIVALSIVMGVLTLCVNEMSKVGKDGKDAILMASSVAILTGSLLLVVIALSALENVNAASLVPSVGALTVVMLSLAGVMAVMGKVFDSGKEALLNASAVAALCGSLIIISVALMMLNTMSWNELLVTVGVIEAVLWSLIFAIKSLDKIGDSKEVLKLASALAIMASTMIIISTALLMLGSVDPANIMAGMAALMVLTSVLMVLSKAIKIKISDALGMIMLASAVIMLAASIKMVAEAGDAFEAVGAIVTLTVAIGLLATAAGAAAEFVIPGAIALMLLSTAMLETGLAIKFVAQALDILATTDFSNLRQNISDIVYGIVMGLKDGIDRIINELFGGVIGVIKNIFTAVGNFGKKITSAIKKIAENFIGGFVKGIVDGIKSVFKGIDELTGGTIGRVLSNLGIHSPSKVMEDVGLNLDAGLLEGINGGAGNVWDGMTNLADGCVGSFDSVIDDWDLSGALCGKVQGSVDDALAEFEKSKARYEEIQNREWSDKSEKDMLVKKFQEQGFDATYDEIQTYLDRRDKGSTKYEYTQDLMEAKRMLGIAQTNYNAYKTLFDKAIINKNQADADKWSASMENVQSKIDEYNRRITLYRQFGASDVSTGGSKGSGGFSANSIEQKANELRWGGYDSSDLGASFENLTAENQDLGYSMDDLSMSLDDLSSGVSSGGNKGVGSGGGSFDDTNIVNELQGLRNDIEMLNRTVANMKIVLDSGELVGAMVNEMDDSLARIAVYKGRGI